MAHLVFGSLPSDKVSSRPASTRAAGKNKKLIFSNF